MKFYFFAYLLVSLAFYLNYTISDIYWYVIEDESVGLILDDIANVIGIMKLCLDLVVYRFYYKLRNLLNKFYSDP